MKEEIVIPLTLFISTAIVIYYFLKARHTERMAIIEKGLNEEQLSYLLKTKKKIDSTSTTNSTLTLKIGVLLIGVGIAVLAGTLAPRGVDDQVVTGLIFLLPGIGLLWAYRYLDKQEASKEGSESIDLPEPE